MKKSLQLLSLAFVALVITSGLRLMYVLPLDTRPFVEKKYSGWNGVLQAWICCDWIPSGSFIRWLNSCATDFENTHEGVYLEFTPVSRDILNTLTDDSIQKPDLLFFSPGLFRASNLLVPLKSCDDLRADLKGYGNGLILPVALGGYIWAYNSTLCEAIPTGEDEFAGLLLPTGKNGYCPALLGLLSASQEIDELQPVLPDNSIDLRLPVSNIEPPLFSDQALELFLKGELPYIPVSSSDLSRLIQLRASGKFPDWRVSASGSIACTDLLLLGGISAQQNGSEREQLAEEFLLSLLDDESQSRLADIGAHAVTGERIYSDFSEYTEMDALLNSRPLWLPSCFSEYSSANSEAIVRGFLNKDFPAKKALGLLGFEGM